MKEIPQPPPLPTSPTESHNWEDELANWQDRDRWNEEWNKQKELNRLENLRLLDNVIYKGTFYRNGNGQKRG